MTLKTLLFCMFIPWQQFTGRKNAVQMLHILTSFLMYCISRIYIFIHCDFVHIQFVRQVAQSTLFSFTQKSFFPLSLFLLSRVLVKFLQMHFTTHTHKSHACTFPAMCNNAMCKILCIDWRFVKTYKACLVCCWKEHFFLMWLEKYFVKNIISNPKLCNKKMSQKEKKLP